MTSKAMTSETKPEAAQPEAAQGCTMDETMTLLAAEMEASYRECLLARLLRPDMVEWFGQWIVTAEGLEAPGEGYELSPDDLWRMNWLLHLSDKSWVDMRSLVAAFCFARKHFASHRPEELTGDFLTDYA